MSFISIPEVFHVGSFDIGMRTERPSLEAFMLSVSVDPDDWSTIARCGGTTWTLTFPEAKWLATSSLDDEQTDQICKWAMEAGYMRPAILWRAWHYDDETECWGYMTCTRESEALLETEDIDPEAEVPSDSGTPVDEVDGYLLTEDGMRELERWHDPAMSVEGAIILWARDVLLAQDSDLVGIWWDEDYNPEALSCPRGGIFPERLDRFGISDPDGKPPPFRSRSHPEP